MFAQGYAYRMDRQFELAVQHFSTALHMYPRFHDALEQRAMAHLDNGKADSAITCLEQMLRTDREFEGVDALLVRAHADKIRANDPSIADPTKSQQELKDDAEHPENNPLAGKTNHYTVLELNYDFTPSELKKSYKRGTKMYHPDRKTGSASAFQRVAFAHKTLDDAELRAKYDEGGDIEKGFNRNGDPNSSHKEEITKKYFPER